VRLIVGVHKPDATFPPDPEKESQWTPLPVQAKSAWDVIPAPEGTLTRALRLTFARGAAAAERTDPLGDLLDAPRAPAGDTLDPDKKPAARDNLEFGKARTGDWRGRLEGMRLLRRRFANITADAAVRVSSGKVAPDGTWDAQRKQPLTEADPGTYLLEWKSSQELRGLAIKEIDGELTKIDVFTGPEGAVVNLAGMENWQHVADYRQERRDHHTGFERANPTARYVDATVDFGKTVRTRAVRLRVVKQWADNAPDSAGIRQDLGGTQLDPARCRVWGVAALKYLGGEPPVDSAAFERIETYDSASGKLLGETPLAKPGMIAVNPAGQLFAVSGTIVVRVERGEKAVPLVTDLKMPTALACDQHGNVYVFDAEPERRQVRVYDPAGKFLRAIGKPGGLQAGPWVPERLGDAAALAVDSKDQLWVVDAQYHPKRQTIWSTVGELKKELLGNTPYGGGGVLDPEDKTRLFYGPLEFELDWKTGLSRIKNLTWTGNTPPGEVPLRIGGRNYLVTRPSFVEQLCAVVYRYEDGKCALAAAMGSADAFEPLKDPRLHLELGSKPLTRCSFLWVDKNGDGAVQASEVTLFEGPRDRPTHFHSDLSVPAGSARYVVKEFLPNGVPVYERVDMPRFQGGYHSQLNDGGFYRLGGDRVPEAGIAADGRVLWTYPHEGIGVQAAHTAKPYRPDQVLSQFGVVGHETFGELGEFVATHTNVGAWNVWTRDGHLVGPIFRDRRVAPARPWSMKEHERGMILTDITCGEEHFSGYLCRTRADNKVYVVAGHNHISILEVLGLDKVRRLTGEITVTEEDLARARAWDARRRTTEVFARSAVVDCYRMRQPPAFDGKLGGWPAADAALESDDPRSPSPAELHIGYDDKYLFLGFRVRHLGPLKNSGTQWDRLFKTGAAVDVQIGTDANAPPDRQAPVKGDLRLLMTYVGAKPMVVLYRPISPGAAPEHKWTVKSPVAELTFDEVRPLPNARLVRGGSGPEYVLEAAVQLADLGWTPAPGRRLRLDWGVLVSGPDGTEVLRRLCWANRAPQITADAPSEARLSPHLWGNVLIQGPRPTTADKLPDLLFQESGSGKDVKKDVTDILDEIKDKPKKK
jgi:hypothetical protein